MIIRKVSYKFAPMKKVLLYIALILCLTLNACSSNDEPKIKEVPRTILVYMIAGNNLGSRDFDSKDITEMIEAAKADDFNGGRLIVYHSTYSSNQLQEITADGVKVLKEYSTPSSSTIHSLNPIRIEEVIKDVKTLAPANDYGLVLWSHANGWLQDGVSFFEGDGTTDIQPTSFGIDQQNKTRLNITDLASVLEGKGFSFIYFDCCYMMTVETLYELRNTTKTFIGSVSELPNEGMPYDENLKCLFATTPDFKQAALNTFNYHNSVYLDSDRACTMSIVDASALNQLATATRHIMETATLLTTTDNIQKFSADSRCYWYDLEQYIETLCNGNIPSEWATAMNNAVQYRIATSTLWGLVDINRHCGLSTYIPTSIDDTSTKGYNELSWYTDVVSPLFE